MLDIKPAEKADRRTRRLAVIAISAAVLVVLYLVANSIAVSDHGVELGRLNHELIQQHSQALRQDRSELKRIEADEKRFCQAAKLTRYQPIIQVLCDQPVTAVPSKATPSPIPSPGGGATPRATPASSAPPPSPTPKPLATPTPSCTVNLLGICI